MNQTFNCSRFYFLNIAKFDMWPPSIRTYEELQKHVSLARHKRLNRAPPTVSSKACTVSLHLARSWPVVLLLSSIFVWIYELKHKAAFFDVLIERKKAAMSTWLTSARLLFIKYSTYLTRCFSAELGVLSAQFGVGCLCAHLLAHFCKVAATVSRQSGGDCVAVFNCPPRLQFDWRSLLLESFLDLVVIGQVIIPTGYRSNSHKHSVDGANCAHFMY